MNNECEFCKVLIDDKHKQIIQKGKHVTAIQKQYQSNNVNFLLISNKHMESARDLDVTNIEDAKIWCEFLTAAKALSKGKDFGLKFTCGNKSGQSVFHMHAHVFSYEKPWFPNNSLFKNTKNTQNTFKNTQNTKYTKYRK